MVDTFAGGKIRSGVPAQEVSLTQLAGIAFDPSGNLVLCDQTSNVIRRIRTDGTIETLAGNGTTGFTGDGGPALNAALNQPAFPRFDAQSNLYFADTSNYRIRRVDSKGVITTIAGSGVPFQTGMDLEGPALSRSLGTIGDLAVDPSGNVYFALASNTDVIRRVTPGGRMEIFAGIPHPDCPYCTDGDNGPALAARIAPGFLAADGKGNVYLTESGSVSGTHIRRIGPDGIITRFAGYGPVPINGTTVDDEAKPALNIFISGIGGMAADGAGNLYYIDPAFTSRIPLAAHPSHRYQRHRQHHRRRTCILRFVRWPAPANCHQPLQHCRRRTRQRRVHRHPARHALLRRRGPRSHHASHPDHARRRHPQARARRHPRPRRLAAQPRRHRLQPHRRSLHRGNRLLPHPQDRRQRPARHRRRHRQVRHLLARQPQHHAGSRAAHLHHGRQPGPPLHAG